MYSTEEQVWDTTVLGARSVCVELFVCGRGDQNVEKTWNILIAIEELIF